MSSIRLTTLSSNLFYRRRRVGFQKSSLLTYESNQELRMKCKSFCENNVLLERVLYELNSHGLTTFACCKGHFSKNGYIAFKVPKEGELLANELCTTLISNFPVGIHIHENRALFRGLSVSISFPTNKRGEILKFILDRIQNPKEQYSDYMTELIRLCNIQESIHDDLMYGVFLKRTTQGFRVVTEPKFFYYSLDRRISLEQLESICNSIDDFTDKSKDKIFTEAELSLELQELNQKLAMFSKDKTYEKRDYYPGKSEDELLWMMLELEGYPGYLKGFVERNRSKKLDSNEHEKICKFNLQSSLYLTLLKLEESYFAKKEKSLQEKKYML